MDNIEEEKEYKSSKFSGIQRRKSIAQRITDSLFYFIPTISKKPGCSNQDSNGNKSQMNYSQQNDDSHYVPKKPNSTDPLSGISGLPKSCLPSTSHSFGNGPAALGNTLSLYSEKPKSRRIMPECSKIIQDDSASELSDKSGVSVSTSGISSLQPHTDNALLDDLASRSRIDSSMGNRRFKRAALAGYSQSLCSGPVVSEKRAMSFISESQSKRQKLNSNSSVCSSQSEASYRKSLFYSGRTFYGGSSNARWDFSTKKRPSVIQETINPIQIEVEKECKKKDCPTVMSSTARKILSSLEKASSVYESGAGFGPSITNPFNATTSSSSRTYHYTPYSSGYRKYRERLSTRAAQNIQRNIPTARISDRLTTLPKSDDTHNENSRDNQEFIQKSTSHRGKMRGSQGTFSENKLETDSYNPVTKVSGPPHIPHLWPENRKLESSTSSVKFTLGNLPIFKPQANIVADQDVDLDSGSTNFGFSSPMSRTPSQQMMEIQPNVTSPNPQIEFKFSLPASSDQVKSTSENFQVRKFEPILKQKPVTTTTASLIMTSGSVLDALKKFSDPVASSKSTSDSYSHEKSSASISDNKSLANKTNESNPTPELAKIFESASTKWNCNTCLAQNDNSSNVCACCQSPRPSQTSNSKSNDNSNMTDTPQLALLKEQAQKRWSCDVCMIENDVAKSSCVACQNPKPSATLSQSKSSVIDTPELIALKSAAGQSWTCDVCMVNNSLSAINCLACGAESSHSKSAGAGKQSHCTPQLMQIQANSAGKWSCDTCLLENGLDKTKCVACETPKPGGTNENSSNTVFQLPNSILQKNNVSSSATNFKFGSSDSSEPKSNFNFGSTKPSENSSGIKFGTSPDTSEPKSSFNFGSTKSSENSSGIKFGSSVPKSSFNFGSTENSSGIKFGSSDTSVPKSSFNFGSTKSSENSSGIKFGGSDCASFKSTFDSPKTDSGSTDSASSVPQNNGTNIKRPLENNPSNSEDSKGTFKFSSYAASQDANSKTLVFGANNSDNSLKGNSKPIAFNATKQFGSDSQAIFPHSVTSSNSGASSVGMSFKFNNNFNSKPSENMFGTNSTQDSAGKQLGFPMKFGNTELSKSIPPSSFAMPTNDSNSIIQSSFAKSLSSPAFNFNNSVNSFAKPSTEQSKPSYIFGQPPTNSVAKDNNDVSKPSNLFGASSKPHVEITQPSINFNKPFLSNASAMSASPATSLFNFGAAASSNSSLFGLSKASTTPQSNSTSLFTVNGLSKSESSPAFQSPNLFNVNANSSSSGSIFQSSNPTYSDSNSNVLKRQITSSESTSTFSFNKMPTSANPLLSNDSTSNENKPNVFDAQSSSSSNQSARPRLKGLRRINR